MNELKKHIRDVPDFPKPGIVFKDITPLLNHPEGLTNTLRYFLERYQNQSIDRVVGIESRGFIFGAPLAENMRKGFVPIRKKGKLPWKTVEYTYALEYGSDTIAMHEDAVKPGEKILLIDDVLATGGTAEAACHLIEKMGAQVVECAFVIELGFLKGRDKLKNQKIFSLLTY